MQCFWANIPNVANRPFIAVLYPGNNKPQDNDFLMGFDEEFKQFCVNEIDDKPVQIMNIICDGQGYCMVKEIIQL